MIKHKYQLKMVTKKRQFVKLYNLLNQIQEKNNNRDFVKIINTIKYFQGTFGMIQISVSENNNTYNNNSNNI